MSSRTEALTPGPPPAAVRVLEVADGTLRLTERPVESPAPGEALVAVAGCAIGADELLEVTAAVPGHCPGRALVGRVAAVPSGERRLEPDALVVAPSRLPCGVCPACRRGRAEACVAPVRPVPGGLASYARLPARDLVPLRGELERVAAEGWRLAAAGSVLLLAYHALSRVGVMPGEVVVVMGLDVVGLAVIEVATAGGATALAVAPDDARLDAARRAGAGGTLSCARLAPAEIAAEVDQWCEASGLGAARRTVVARAGGRAHLARAVAMVEAGGALVVLGRPLHDAHLDMAPLAERGATVVVLEDGHPDLLAECLALCARGAVSLSSLTVGIAAAEVGAALDGLRRGDDTRLPILRFGDD
jgi:threonine dehydrogenase-like Zn-dependent dehydrogenase